jgi:G6PDH family F420-dependent oxidoreductase
VYVAASGSESVALAARAGGGLIATEPRRELTEGFDEAAGPGKPKYGQPAVSVDDDEARARRAAHELFRFGLPGWTMQSELPNVVNFEAATAYVREEDVAKAVSCGPDVDRHVEALEQWTQAGFDRIAIVALGDTDRFFAFWEQELHPGLEASAAVKAEAGVE